jgi:hypothetical protein
MKIENKLQGPLTVNLSADTAAALGGTSEGLILALDTNGEGVIAPDGSSAAFVVLERADLDSPDVLVHPLNSGGIVRAVQSEAIAQNALVTVSGGRLVPAGGDDPVVGRKLTNSDGAAGDIIALQPFLGGLGE